MFKCCCGDGHRPIDEGLPEVVGRQSNLPATDTLDQQHAVDTQASDTLPVVRADVGEADAVASEEDTQRISHLAVDSLPPELLRGVQVQRTLWGLGRAWDGLVSPSGTNFHHLSEQVERLDDFISHDWRTPRC